MDAETDKDTEVTTTFQELGLARWLVKLLAELGLSKPTPVQANCIPAILEGRDVIGAAKTGSGKTAAFALPILSKLSEDPYGIYALVITPARELGVQISEQFKALGHPINVRQVCLIGGGGTMTQLTNMDKQPHVVVATPGRLAGFIRDNPTFHMRSLKFLVLDEVDRLLSEVGFKKDLEEILEFLPPNRQTLLFSATMHTNAQQLKALAPRSSLFYNGCKQRLETVSTLEQQYLFLPELVKECYLVFLVKKMENTSIMIFTNTVWDCELLKRLLVRLEIPALALHSANRQSDRNEALHAFKSSYIRVLVATDVASRGLDIPAVELVINFDVPQDPADYVHRSGRTARAGRAGTVVSFVTPNEVERIHEIESTIDKKLDKYDLGEKEAVILKELSKVSIAKSVINQRMEEKNFAAKLQEKKDKQKARETEEDSNSGKPKSKKQKPKCKDTTLRIPSIEPPPVEISKPTTTPTKITNITKTTKAANPTPKPKEARKKVQPPKQDEDEDEISIFSAGKKRQKLQ